MRLQDHDIGLNLDVVKRETRKLIKYSQLIHRVYSRWLWNKKMLLEQVFSLIIPQSIIESGHEPNFGCVSYFCTRLRRAHRGGSRTPQKGLAPGIGSAGARNRLRGRSRSTGVSRGLWPRKPSEAHAPPRQGPQGLGESVLAVRLSLAAVLGGLLGLNRLPGLMPASVADGVAQHEHGIDIVSLPAHPGSF